MRNREKLTTRYLRNKPTETAARPSGRNARKGRLDRSRKIEEKFKIRSGKTAAKALEKKVNQAFHVVMEEAIERARTKAFASIKRDIENEVKAIFLKKTGVKVTAKASQGGSGGISANGTRRSNKNVWVFGEFPKSVTPLSKNQRTKIEALFPKGSQCGEEDYKVTINL